MKLDDDPQPLPPKAPKLQTTPKSAIVTYANHFITCKIWGFHGDDYDDYHLAHGVISQKMIIIILLRDHGL
jgi:hypothetical protein